MSAPKTVLITGASSGIGLACARVLADRGLRVFWSSRRPPPGEQPFEFVAMDVTSIEEVHAQLDTNLLGPLRVVRAVAPHMRRQGSGLIVMVGRSEGRDRRARRGTHRPLLRAPSAATVTRAAASCASRS